MQDTKSISPEVKVLFEKIHKQAAQYNDTFEQIELHANKLEELAKDVTNRTADMELRINSVLESINYRVESSLKRLAEDTYKVNEKSFILSELIELKQEHENLIANLKTSSERLINDQKDLKELKAEINKIVKETKARIDKELDNYLEEHKKDFKETIHKELKHTEDSITLNQRQLEGKLKIIEKSHGDDIKQHSKELTMMNATIMDMKKIVTSLNQSILARYEDIDQKFKEMVADFNNKIVEVDELKDKIENDLGISNNSNSDDFNIVGAGKSNDDDSRLTNLSSLVYLLREDITNMEKKSKLSINLSLISAGVALIVLALSLLM